MDWKGNHRCAETSGGPDLAVSCTPGADNRGSKQDRFRFRISTDHAGAGQPLEINGTKVGAVEFTITGVWEVEQFLDAVAALAEAYREQGAEWGSVPSLVEARP